MNRWARTAIVASVIAFVPWVCAVAGPLDPPAGPIASTHKTLTQVEPRTPLSSATTPGDADSLFKITQPGSYYLTGNVVGVAGKHGIEIGISGVTVDLNGFELVGVAGSLNGVFAGAALSNIAVLNGAAHTWGGKGIFCVPAVGCRVDNVLAIGNDGGGIWLSNSSVITGCVSRGNAAAGLAVGEGSIVRDCSSSFNGGIGIAAENGSTVTGCVSYFNTGIGITVTKSTVTGCTSSANFAIGILASDSCVIESCSVSDNTGDGINVTSSSLVRACECGRNGLGAAVSAGIQVFGSGSRIEGNNCTDADFGIKVGSGGNVIVRNTCADNTTNWSVVGGNICFVVNASAAGPINGNSGGTPPGSTDPSANFTY